uniref:Uncharacterized protein n=1 Tax=Manihot esculenta TaxID=3983 RepID=A0A2C9WQ23_MANES
MDRGTKVLLLRLSSMQRSFCAAELKLSSHPNLVISSSRS